MPAVLEAPPAPNPFGDLIPKQLIGGENGAPAEQIVGDKFSAVPKAEINVPTDYGAFADLVPDSVKTQGAQDYGPFSDLVPQSPTSATEKAVAESPLGSGFGQFDAAYKKAEKSVPPFHQAMNALRSLASGAGKYIFEGLQGFEQNRAKLLANPPAELLQPQGDELILPDGSVMSKEQQDALEQRYHDAAIARIPDAKAKADYFKQLATNADTSLYVDPELAKTVPARIAHAAGSAGIMAVESLIPYAGIPFMVMHGAMATEAEAKNAGKTDAEAEAAGVRSAIGLALFGGASKLAALGVAKLLPEGTSTVTKFLSQFLGQETANETSSRAITAWEAAANAPEGKKIESALNALKDETLEQGTLNAVYALAHANKAAAKEPVRPETAPETQPQGEPNAVQIRSATPEVSRVTETGQDQPSSSEGVGSSEQGIETARAPQVAKEPIGIADAIAEIQRRNAPEPQETTISPERELLSKLDLNTERQYEQPRGIGGNEPARTTGEGAASGQPETQGQDRPISVAPEEKARKFRGPADTFGSEVTPVAAHIINDVGGLMSKSTAKRFGIYEKNADLWDGAPTFDHPTHNKVYNSKGGETPDHAAQSAYEEGLISEPSPDALYAALKKESHTARTIQREERTQQPGLFETTKAKMRDASAMMQDVVNESRKTGLVAPGSTGVQGGIEHLGRIWRQIRELPKFGDFKRAILGFGQRMQSSFLEAKEIQRALKTQVPSRIAREGIFNFIEAGGDKSKLAIWRDASPETDLKRGYDAALNLTPSQEAVAAHLAEFYSNKLAEGQAAGILAEGRENYVNRIVDKRRSKGFAPIAAGGTGLSSSGRLSKNFKHGLHRVFENSFDAERNGIRYKTKDVAELAPIYLTEMNKTIGTRNLLADLAHGTAEDGRALAYPKGQMITLSDQGATTSRLIKPNAKQMVVDEITGQDVSSHDYSTVDHPALTGWKWVGADENGKPILVQGNLALHPEIARHVSNLLGESALRKWYNSDGSPLASIPKGIVRNIDKAQQVAKELLFSGSGFHHANIGFHAVEHRVNPIPEFFKSLSRDYTIDPGDAKVQDWMQHSLQLAPDQLSARHFMEGYGGRSVQKVPIYGRIASAISDHLFERFIPALKLRLANAMLERNMRLYAGDIAANKVTPDQVKYLSAQQANAALSHVNYIDIGRSPTLQHLFSLTMLAPDFTESRARFLSQAGKTLLGSKAGAEQFMALAYGAGLIWTMARVINKVSDDDYHFEEPFSVVHNGRVYGIRSIQGDLAHMLTDTRKFVYGRISPLARLFTEQFITGTNYRGEKIGHLESLKEYLANYVPISLKNMPGLRDLFETTRNNPVTPWESFMTAMGIQTSRYSPITKTYQLARAYNKEQGVAEDKGVYPVSKYQQLRYALEDGDLDRARTEYQKLIGAGEKPSKLSSGFRESVLHPFTGSQASDTKFKKSLSGDDRLMFDLAVKKRHDILRRYQSLHTR